MKTNPNVDVRSHKKKDPPTESLEAKKKRLEEIRLGMGGDTDSIDSDIAAIDRLISGK